VRDFKESRFKGDDSISKKSKASKGKSNKNTVVENDVVSTARSETSAEGKTAPWETFHLDQPGTISTTKYLFALDELTCRIEV
jgi:hypothetical protein